MTNLKINIYVVFRSIKHIHIAGNPSVLSIFSKISTFQAETLHFLK